MAVVRIEREKALAVVVFAGWNNAARWEDKKLGERLTELEDVIDKDKIPEDEEVASTLIDIMTAIEEGTPEFEIYREEVDEKEEVDFDNSLVELYQTDEQQEQEKVNTEETAEKPVKKEKKTRKKKEKEPEETYDVEEVLKSFASDVPKFEFHPNFTPAQAKGVIRANVQNRPYRVGISKRYAEDMIRRKWGNTLEPWVFDSTGRAVSAQHRAHGLLLAEKLRQSNPEYYKDNYGWDGEITIPVVLAFGADPTANDLHDRGQLRSGADVLYRRAEFDGDGLKPSVVKKLSRDLSIAARLCWMQMGEKKVSDAPHFPHSEMIEFLEDHPNLKGMVEFVYKEDAEKEKRIVSYISRGYMAGLAYLFSASKTVKESGEIDLSNLSVAEDFVAKLAAGTFDNEDHPIRQLREWFVREKSKDAKVSRDVKIGLIIKVWKAYANGETMTSKDMKLKRKEGIPTIGGLA